MSTLSAPHSVQTTKPNAVALLPPLASGNRLSHADYMQRYETLPGHVKAERIEGTVYLAAAATSAGFHGEPHLYMATWIGTYVAMTSGVHGADNTTIELDVDNDPQPDLCVYVHPASGGRVALNERRYIVGSPEMIIEIAASSASYDLGIKQHVFLRNRVSEYVVYRTYDGEIDWFVLRGGQYERVPPDAQGIHRSEVFPGLWLNAAALISDDLAAVLSTLQAGLATAEHQAFVNKLANSRRP